MTTQNKNVPALRFPEFAENWESKRLREIANIYDGTHQTPKYVSEGVKFVSVENIEDIENTNKFITKEAFEKDFKTKPQANDILMTRITAGIIGATAIIKDNNPLAYYVSLALIRSKNGLDVKFLNQRINSHQFKHELHKRIIHVAFPKKINLGEIGECEASLPTLPEQQKIAAFLTAVDEKIQQLARKKDILEQYKKGVMQKIFNQEIRFKDDNGNDFADWEEKKLGDVGENIIGLTYSPKDVVNDESGVIVLRSSNIKDERLSLDDLVKVRAKINDKLKIRKNDILICTRNGSQRLIGKNIIIQDTETPMTFGAFMSVFRSEYNNFIVHLFKTDIYLEQIQANLGARINQITTKNLNAFKFNFPCVEEQEKISKFLSAIDDKINLVNQQLEKTKEYKKGLLQQMFV